MRTLKPRYAMAIATATVVAVAIPTVAAAAPDNHPQRDAETVAALDTSYQAAVKRNDAATMSRILADDFVLVTGKGSVFTRANLIDDARNQACAYEHQEEIDGTRTVRLFGRDTAVMTAQLFEKGSCTDGSTFDAHLWFSDTYVRTNGHWQYHFGQASRPL